MYWTMTRRTTAAEHQRARAEAVRAAAVINTELTRLPRVVDAVAADLSAGRLLRAQIPDRMRTAMDTLPQMFGIGLAYTPYAFDPNLRLYAPYVRRQGDGLEPIELDSIYDYTQAGQEWYEAGLKNGATWSEPGITGAHSSVVVEYSAPFTEGPPSAGARPPAGVVHGAMSLLEIDDLIKSLDLGDFGYGFLVSKKGFVVSHPYAAEIMRAETVKDVTTISPREAAAKRMLEAVRSGHTSEVEDAIDLVTGGASLILTEPVPSTGWTVGVVFLKQAAAQEQAVRRVEMRLTVAVVATAVFLLVTIMLWRYNGTIKPLWAGVIAGNAILMVGIGVLWFQGYASPPVSAASSTAFVNGASVRKFTTDATRASLKRNGALPIFVPTGVLLETLEVLGPNNILVTGYVWQKYASNIPASVKRGFVLPEASDRTITESYRRMTEDAEVIGWRFKATIRQSFDYAKYPLDQQRFRLRLRHEDFANPAILIPDLESYAIIHPLAKLGLEKNFTLPGWAIERTEFRQEAAERTTSFGLSSTDHDDQTELAFNLVLNRLILEPVLASLLPVAVSGFMGFALLLLVKESTRVNVVQLLSAYSALFFVVILSELDLRRRVSSSSMMYIEYFYFVLYGAILTVALITITNAYTGHFPRVERREHLFPKLLFWPVIFATLFVVTLVIFY